MFIETERMEIRFVEESDWKQIKEIWEDFASSEYARYDRPNDTDDGEARLRIAKWAAANRAGPEHMFFAVCISETVIGYVAFNIRENGYETGYCFRSAFHGKGYAKESISALIGRMFASGVTRITAGTAMENLPSVALLRSLGFRQTGTEKVSFRKDVEGNDDVFDGGIFELTKE